MNTRARILPVLGAAVLLVAGSLSSPRAQTWVSQGPSPAIDYGVCSGDGQTLCTRDAPDCMTAGGTCAFGVCTGDAQTICNTTADCSQAGGVCDTDFLDYFPAENLSRNAVTGAIETVVAHPTNANILWVGGVNGGVFTTQNATAASPSWTSSTDSMGSLSIGALELDPTDMSNETLVAGIGRTSAYGGDGGKRSGLLRTANGGSSWTLLPAIAGKNIVGVAPRGSVIVVAANNSDAGFNCPDVGIFRSTDTGAGFTQISNNEGTTGLPCGISTDLASDPTDPTRLFAPVQGAGVGIYRSTNTGANWTKVSDAAMDALLAFRGVCEVDVATLCSVDGDCNAVGGACALQDARVEIAVGRAGGANANVFVAIANVTGASGGSVQWKLVGLLRSGDAGNTWTALDLPQTMDGGVAVGIHPGGQGNTHLSIVADPANHNVCYVGGDSQPSGPSDTQPNSIGGLGFVGRLFRVDAGQAQGSQATPITHCMTAQPGCGGSARTAGNTAPHADSREMVFDANGDIIQTDDGGVYRHTDPNGTTGDWVSVVGDLAFTEQHDFAYDTVSDVYISGNQDNGSTQQGVPANSVWYSIGGGDGGDVAVAPNDPMMGQSTRYTSSQNFGSAERRVYDANNVLQSVAQPALGGAAAQGQFVTPIEVNAANPVRLILGGGNGTFESLDRLDTLTQISPAVVNSDGGSPIAYGTTANPEVLYFASADKVYVRTAAHPAMPVETDPDAGGTTPVNGVVLDPDDANAAFAVDASKVFRTTNAGTGWTDITGNLQSLTPGRIRTVAYVNTGGDRVVVGTDIGVYEATEASGFTTWAATGCNLPNTPVFQLEFDAARQILAAGTLGRGTWKLDTNMACTAGAAANDLVADLGSNGLWLYANNATWSQLNSTDPEGVAVGDIDGNGIDDVVADFGGGGTWIRFDNGNWQQIALPPGSDNKVMSIGNLDGDATRDIVFNLGATNGVRILYDGTPPLQFVANVDPENILAGADLDGNGMDDPVFDLGASGLAILWNNANSLTTLSSTLNPQSMISANFNGNNREDLIFDFGPGAVTVYQYLDGMTWNPWLFNIDPALMNAGELNGSGNDEVVLYFSGNRLTYINESGAWRLLLSNVDPAIFAIADLNTNGTGDLVVHMEGAAEITYLYSDSSSWRLLLNNVAAEVFLSGNLDGVTTPASTGQMEVLTPELIRQRGLRNVGPPGIPGH